MKISQDAMEDALVDFHELQYSRELASLYESYLVAKWFEANELEQPQISDANDAVDAIFALSPAHTLGRLYPFRYDWTTTESSGRKTVWNNTTRGGSTLAASIFNEGGEGNEKDIRHGLQSTAARQVKEAITSKNKRFPRWTSLACLILREYEFNDEDEWNDVRALLKQRLNLTDGDLELITNQPIDHLPLLADSEWRIDLLPDKLAPRESAGRKQLGITEYERSADEIVEVVLDRRVEEMLKQAVSKYPFIMLVGPPGTGKGTLIKWLMEDISIDPTKYGFKEAFKPPSLWRTPDESWSAFELIGGYVPNSEGNLEWSPGLLLNALVDEKWLILDEANRADMDRIMGPLLTWLSEQDVEIGRTRPHDGESIVLGWTKAPENRVHSTTDGIPVKYLAGSHWRMFGTYNPQDALRVFRFGQALSRRFVIVPIPAISSGQFEELLNSNYRSLGDDYSNMITGLYSAHLQDKDTTLGPAVFLRMARYLHPLGSDMDMVDDKSMKDKVAEAYVMNVGKYLASYDDDMLNSLMYRVLEEWPVFGVIQWDWIMAQRNTIL